MPSHEGASALDPAPRAPHCPRVPAATTIDEVLARLDAIIADARRQRRRTGYFAVLYRDVTAGVKRGIAAGEFDDGPRMERLDVVFANRYLDAYDAHHVGRPTSRAWSVAFRAARRWPPLVLQHLMLGMNAHIALDLGIAAAEVCPGDALSTLERDFGRINALLGGMIDEVQRRLTVISPWMGVLDRVGQRTDEALCGFCLERARDVAWQHARRLAPLTPEEQALEIDTMDLLATALALPIHSPGVMARAAMLGVRLGEPRDVARAIDALAGR